MSNKYTSVYDWLKYIKAHVVGINLRELRLNNMIRYIEANSSTIINKWYMQFGEIFHWWWQLPGTGWQYFPSAGLLDSLPFLVWRACPCTVVKVHSGVAADGQSTMPKVVSNVKLIEPPCTERWCERSDIGNILLILRILKYDKKIKSILS